METTALPSSCAVALKEWASVLSAMAQGAQLLLIRKGGLIEPGSGFELASPSFVFYPTFEHQTVSYLRPDCRHYFEDALQRRAPDGQVRIELFGLAVSSVEVQEPAVVERVSAFHIYNEAFLRQRLKWQPQQPLVIVVVRAFRLAEPLLLPLAPHYAGCRSWVSLESAIPLEGARPVLEEPVFQQRVQTLTALLASQ